MSSGSPVSTYTFTNCSINNITTTNYNGIGTSIAEASKKAAAAAVDIAATAAVGVASSTTTAEAAGLADDTTSKSKIRSAKRAAADLMQTQ